MFDDPTENDLLQRLNKIRSSTPTSDYDALFEKHGQVNNVDPDLLRAMANQESTFNPRAKSPKGAKGLMQLMDGTARRMGVKNVYDPDENIGGGARYMSQLLDMFNDDVPLALAGYNAGEDAVKKYGNKIPPYQETQGYVKKIGAKYQGTGRYKKGTPNEVDAVDLAVRLQGIRGDNPPTQTEPTFPTGSPAINPTMIDVAKRRVDNTDAKREAKTSPAFEEYRTKLGRRPIVEPTQEDINRQFTEWRTKKGRAPLVSPTQEEVNARYQTYLNGAPSTPQLRDEFHAILREERERYRQEYDADTKAFDTELNAARKAETDEYNADVVAFNAEQEDKRVDALRQKNEQWLAGTSKEYQAFAKAKNLDPYEKSTIDIYNRSLPKTQKGKRIAARNVPTSSAIVSDAPITTPTEYTDSRVIEPAKNKAIQPETGQDYSGQQIKLINGKVLVNVSNDPTYGVPTLGWGRYLDDKGETYLVNPETGETIDESLANIAVDVPIKLSSATEGVEQAKRFYMMQAASRVGEMLTGKGYKGQQFRFNLNDIYDYFQKKGVVNWDTKDELTDRDYFATPKIVEPSGMGPHTGGDTTFKMSRREVEEMIADLSGQKESRTQSALQKLSEGRTFTDEELIDARIDPSEFVSDPRYAGAKSKNYQAGLNQARIKNGLISQGWNEYAADIESKAQIGLISRDKADPEIAAVNELYNEFRSQYQPNQTMADKGLRDTVHESRMQKLLNTDLEMIRKSYGSYADYFRIKEKEEKAEAARQQRLAQTPWGEWVLESLWAGFANIPKSALRGIGHTFKGAPVYTKPLMDYLAPIFGGRAVNISDHAFSRASDTFQNWADGINTNKDYDQELVGMIGQGLGSTAAFALLGGGNPAGMAIAASLQIAGSDFDELLNQAKARGREMSEAEASAFARLDATLFGWTEMLGMGKVANRFLKGMKGAKAIQFRRALVNTLKEGAEEVFLNEVPQTVGHNLLTQLKLDPTRKWDKGVMDAVKSAGGSATLASAFASALLHVKHRRNIVKYVRKANAEGNPNVLDLGVNDLYINGQRIKEQDITSEMRPMVDQHRKLKKEIEDGNQIIDEFMKRAGSATDDRKARNYRQTVGQAVQNQIELAQQQKQVAADLIEASGIRPPTLIEQKAAIDLESLDASVERIKQGVRGKVQESAPKVSLESNKDTLTPESNLTPSPQPVAGAESTQEPEAALPKERKEVKKFLDSEVEDLGKRIDEIRNIPPVDVEPSVSSEGKGGAKADLNDDIAIELDTLTASRRSPKQKTSEQERQYLSRNPDLLPDVDEGTKQRLPASDIAKREKATLTALLESGDLTPERATELGHFEAYPELAKKYAPTVAKDAGTQEAVEPSKPRITPKKPSETPQTRTKGTQETPQSKVESKASSDVSGKGESRYETLRAKDQKDYIAKKDFLQGYLDLDRQRTVLSEKTIGLEANSPKYATTQKEFDRLDDALRLQVEQGAKHFGITPDDFISLVNEYESDKSAIKQALLPQKTSVIWKDTGTTFTERGDGLGPLFKGKDGTKYSIYESARKDGTRITVEAHKYGSRGKPTAVADFVKGENGLWKAATEVYSQDRRNRVMSAIYDYVTKKHGDIEPSDTGRTKQGQAFWDKNQQPKSVSLFKSIDALQNMTTKQRQSQLISLKKTYGEEFERARFINGNIAKIVHLAEKKGVLQKICP